MPVRPLRLLALVVGFAIAAPAAVQAIMLPAPPIWMTAQDALNRETAQVVLDTLTGRDGTAASRALDAADVAIAKRREFVGAELPADAGPRLDALEAELDVARALYAAPAAADALAYAVALAKDAGRRQGSLVGETVAVPVAPAPSAGPAEAVRRLLAALDVAATPEQDAAVAALDDLPTQARDALRDHVDAFAAFHAEAVAAGAAAKGSALGARERVLDTALALRDALAAAALVPPDPVDVPPAVAIDLRSATNAWTNDYALLLDAGGADTYTNNAGGNGIHLPGAPTGCGVDPAARVRAAAAAVDLGGDDRYVAHRDCGVNGGGANGYGLLVDAGGDDVYDAGHRGVNGGAVLGAGMLVDASGNDRYAAAGVGTNGGAYNGGVGLLVDGAGNDAYDGADLGVNGGAGGIYNGLRTSGVLVDASGADVYEGYSGGVNGGAYGVGGGGSGANVYGLLVDLAGDDAYRGQDYAVNGGASTALVSNSGAQRTAVGLVFDASGNDDYAARRVAGNGGGIFQGAGMLVDGSGHDEYVGEGRSPLAWAPSLATATAVALADAATPPTEFVVRQTPLAAPPVGAAWLGGTVVGVDAAAGFAVVQTDAPLATVTAALALPGFDWVEENGRVEATFVPNDPRYGEQYGPGRVRLPTAWDATLGDATRTVCILDTGMRSTHLDLSGARFAGGRDFVDDDEDPEDVGGHGTHVAGIAAASTDNALGVAGASQARVLVGRVLGPGGGTHADVASGIRWCADEGAHIVSMSLGGGASAVVEEAVNYAWDRGVLLVAAAGNSGNCAACIAYPGAFEKVLTVQCTDSEDARCSFSSNGPEAEVTAPGYGILSTSIDGDDAYELMSGTSMSTPLVAGVAALVWSAAPNLTNCNLRALLKASARDLGAVQGWDPQTGHGLLDAAAALERAVAGERPTTCDRSAPQGGWIAMNGGGLATGLGFLLDATGNDRYAAAGWMATNGGGWGGGAGLLADGRGSDTYEGGREGTNGGGHAACLTNPCATASPAVALLADGGGTDTYREGDGPPATDATVFPKGTYGAQLDALG